MTGQRAIPVPIYYPPGHQRAGEVECWDIKIVATGEFRGLRSSTYPSELLRGVNAHG